LEAWHNTVKHAGATAITTTIASDGAAVTIRAADNGCGFDPATVPAGHLGLRTMRERANAIGAAFGMASAPGEGTIIALRVPTSPPVPEPAVPSQPGRQEVSRP